MTRRVLAHYVRFQGRLRRLAVLEWDGEAAPRIVEVEGEIHSTVFFNGVVAVVSPGCQLPASVRAAEVEGLMKKLPEPEPGQPYDVVMIPFSA